MRSSNYRILGLLAVALIVGLGAWSCSDGPGMGTLSLYMGFGNGLSAGVPAVAPLGEDFGSQDRTPLSDVILSFNSVKAWSCTEDDSLEDADDDSLDDDDHGDDAALVQPLHDDDEEDEDDDCTSFDVLADTTITLSAGALDSTLAHFLGSALLPEGDYDFLTLGNVQAWVVTAAGETVEAKVPSGRIKVQAPFNITTGGTTDLLIVFDIRRSVVETPPGSLNFIVKPVIHSQIGWDHEDDEDEDGDD
jgi:hypothetical protein